MFDIQKHKFILIQILKDVYSDKEIGSVLGFKGGTAVYLFYNLPRFSTDLDFSLLNEKKADLVFKRIAQISRKYAVIKDSRQKRFTIFFLLSYSQESKNIKIEISKRKFPEYYEVKNYLGVSILTMKKEDIFAHKLVALLDRKSIANRDLFDLWYFLKNNWEINRALVELRTKEKFKTYLRKCLKAFEKVNETYILQGLGEVLEKEYKAWAKENLKKDLIFLMKYYLETLDGH